jgi:hypothetical protein
LGSYMLNIYQLSMVIFLWNSMELVSPKGYPKWDTEMNDSTSALGWFHQKPAWDSVIHSSYWYKSTCAFIGSIVIVSLPKCNLWFIFSVLLLINIQKKHLKYSINSRWSSWIETSKVTCFKDLQSIHIRFHPIYPLVI